MQRGLTDVSSNQIYVACHFSRIAVRRVGVVAVGTYQLPPPAGIFLLRAHTASTDYRWQGSQTGVSGDDVTCLERND